MTPKEILIAARAKIEAPERWGKGRFSRLSDGSPCYPDDDRAFCFCAEGAVFASGARWAAKAKAMTFLRDAAVGDEFTSIPDWNDAPTRTHTEVIAAFDRAIAAAGDA